MLMYYAFSMNEKCTFANPPRLYRPKEAMKMTTGGSRERVPTLSSIQSHFFQATTIMVFLNKPSRINIDILLTQERVIVLVSSRNSSVGHTYSLNVNRSPAFSD